MKSIVLISGGLDSTVCLRQACDAREPCEAIFFDYGQIAAERELAAVTRICGRLGVSFRKVDLPWLRETTHSPLVDPAAAWPVLTARDIAAGSEVARESAARVWIPNRNAVFINAAAAFAESLGADKIVVGFNAEEAVTFADNSGPFLAAINESLRHSVGHDVQVAAPLGDLTKVQIVQLGKQINAPLDLIWSCYRAERKLCWRCESCMRLHRALSGAGLLHWFNSLSYMYGVSPVGNAARTLGTPP